MQQEEGRRKENNIEMMPVGRLREHPDNPRKDKGDLTELTDSIRKKGIMQNLTVVPDPEGNGYLVLIGNRRFAAALEAGLTELPCRIESDIPRSEQVAIMLEENIQRNDLTVLEQADGFQMMLDLGETVDTVAEKTGFSKSTVYHRLNIAKLDHELIEGFADDGFQLTLNDLYELEKVPDVEARNRILKMAQSPEEVVTRAQGEVRKARIAANEKEFEKRMEEAGLKAAPEDASIYDVGKWHVIEEWALDRDLPEEMELPEDRKGIFYLCKYNTWHILRKVKKGKHEPTEQEIRERKRKARRKELEEKYSQIKKRMDAFLDDMTAGRGTGPKITEDIKDEIWRAIAEEKYNIWPQSEIHGFESKKLFGGKSQWNLDAKEKEQLEEAVAEMPVHEQMLIILAEAMRKTNPYTWDGKYEEQGAAALIRGFKLLEKWGWYFEDGEKEIIDGTSDLYDKE